MTLRSWRIALVVWMGLIFLMAGRQMSADVTEEVFGNLNYLFRKAAHIVEYAILTYLWMRSIWTVPERLPSCLVWSVVLSAFYAVTDEVHQSFVPQRLGIWYDVVLDGIGALAMGYILWRVHKQGGDVVRRWVLGPAGEGVAPDRSAAIK